MDAIDRLIGLIDLRKRYMRFCALVPLEDEEFDSLTDEIGEISHEIKEIQGMPVMEARQKIKRETLIIESK